MASILSLPFTGCYRRAPVAERQPCQLFPQPSFGKPHVPSDVTLAENGFAAESSANAVSVLVARSVMLHPQLVDSPRLQFPSLVFKPDPKNPTSCLNRMRVNFAVPESSAASTCQCRIRLTSILCAHTHNAVNCALMQTCGPWPLVSAHPMCAGKLATRVAAGGGALHMSLCEELKTCGRGSVFSTEPWSIL